MKKIKIILMLKTPNGAEKVNTTIIVPDSATDEDIEAEVQNSISWDWEEAE